MYLLNGLYFYRYSGYIRYCGVGETRKKPSKYLVVLFYNGSRIMNSSSGTAIFLLRRKKVTDTAS